MFFDTNGNYGISNSVNLPIFLIFKNRNTVYRTIYSNSAQTLQQIPILRKIKIKYKQVFFYLLIALVRLVVVG